MPNWIEGVLKVRGTRENIEKFVKEGIDYNDYKFEIAKNEEGKFEAIREIPVPRQCEIKIDDYDIFVEKVEDLHIKGTRRMFVNANTIEGWWRQKENEILCIDVRQAWAFIADNLKQLSEKYNLDFCVFGTERGMEFCQFVEVIGGEVVKDQEIKFDDFEWECPDPRLGG